MSNKLIPPNEVVINFSCLIDNKLTSDLYILLHWKYYNNYELPWTIAQKSLEDDLSLEYLESQGFIKIIGNNDFELREKARLLFATSSVDEKWLEFLGTFPLKVPAQNGGTRPLKVANPESKANDRVKAKYIALIKDKPNMHKYIMDVLKAEMKMRRNSNNLQYMNALEAWLNQANYDKYAYLLEEVSSDYKNEDYM